MLNLQSHNKKALSIESSSHILDRHHGDQGERTSILLPRDGSFASGSNRVHLYNQMATHVPDVVMFADHCKQLPYQITTQNVLMFLDISGFTALCESFNHSKNGADTLTKILNGYMFALVNEIISNDGDILKFAGDAILTSWKVEGFRNMKITVAHVIACALSIQRKYGKWKTPIGINLRVKIGISAGEVNTAYLGNEEFCHNVTLGRAVESVNIAEKFCLSGDTVISPSAWCHCSGLPLEYEVLSDKKHMKILDIGETELLAEYQMVRTVSKTDSIADILGDTDGQVEVSRSNTRELDGLVRESKIHRLSLFGESVLDTTTVDANVHTDEVSVNLPVTVKRVRRAILENDTFVNERLRLYVAPQVMRKLDENQRLEYLSEMRQVTIVFINLQLEKVTKYELCRTLQVCFNIIYDAVKSMLGNLNKVFMFDKGCTFLVVFGLPGFKHDNDCAHALTCSYHMKEELSQIDKVSQCSIGVTTGSTFCGVVGHAHRHEYTVIGRKVNMAARLMMYYLEKVTCDNETFHHSNLHKSNFETLEQKAMKGLQNVGTIREFTKDRGTEGTVEALKIQELEHPLIGRDEELATIVEKLHKMRYKSAEQASPVHTIVLQGESGIGKTRMLDSTIVKATQDDFRIIFCVLGMNDVHSPFYTVKTLLRATFDFSIDMTHRHREELLLNLFRDDAFIIKHLGIFNDWLNLKIDQTEGYATWQDDDLTNLFHEMLYKIIDKLTQQQGKLFFAMDDAHYIDQQSWEFVAEFGRHPLAIVVCALRSSSTIQHNQTIKQITSHPSTFVVNLDGLGPECMTALGCQLLGVVQIPRRVERLLQQKSQGVPAWCEQLLQSMCQEGTLQIMPMAQKPSDEPMVMPEARYLPQRDVMEARKLVPPSDRPATRMVAVIPAAASLDIRIPNSLRGMIQTRIDQLYHTDQLVVKTAAVLGSEFPVDMLESTFDHHMGVGRLYSALRRLVRMNILECDSLEERYAAHSHQQKVEEEINDKADQHSINLDDTVRFVSADVQETAYEMFLESVRRQLHIRAAQFLESLAHRCSFCGGGSFLDKYPLYVSSQHDFMAGDLCGISISSRKDTMTTARPPESKRHTLKEQCSQILPRFLSASMAKVTGTDDLHECTCHLILKDIHPQLVRHWKLAGSISRTVNILMESAAAAITTDDGSKALEYLEELHHILMAVKQGKNPFEGEVTRPDFYEFDDWLEARCESLFGQAQSKLDRTEESLKHFNNALCILGAPQHYGWWHVWRVIICEALSQLYRQRCVTQSSTTQTKVRDIKQLIEQARCLSHIFRYHLKEGKIKLALMTVLQQLNKAEEGSVNFQQLISAYTCMMECCHRLRLHRRGLYYENLANRRCQEMPAVARTRSGELATVVRFYEVSMNMQLCWGAITKAVYAGYAGKMVLDIMRDTARKIQVLPLLAEASMLVGKVSDTAEILEDLENATIEQADLLGKTWYYSCCMDLLLETGCQVECAQKCIAFTTQIGYERAVLTETLPFHCISSCLALWCVRIGDIKEAKQWMKLADQYRPEAFVCYMAAWSFVRLIEVKLILHCQMTRTATPSAILSHDVRVIRQDLKQLKKITEILPVLKPRMMILDAYLLMLQRKRRQSKNKLNQCISLCKKYDNKADELWAAHNMAMWYSMELPMVPRCSWSHLANSGTMTDWHTTYDNDYTPLKYTLPSPIE